MIYEEKKNNAVYFYNVSYDKEKTLKPLSEAGIRCIKMLSHEEGPSQFETVNCWDEIKELLSKKRKVKQI